jgi:hypothetical protein
VFVVRVLGVLCSGVLLAVWQDAWLVVRGVGSRGVAGEGEREEGGGGGNSLDAVLAAAVLAVLGLRA